MTETSDNQGEPFELELCILIGSRRLPCATADLFKCKEQSWEQNDGSQQEPKVTNCMHHLQSAGYLVQCTMHAEDKLCC